MKWQIEKVDTLEAVQLGDDLLEKTSTISNILKSRKYEHLFAAKN